MFKPCNNLKKIKWYNGIDLRNLSNYKNLKFKNVCYRKGKFK